MFTRKVYASACRCVCACLAVRDRIGGIEDDDVASGVRHLYIYREFVCICVRTRVYAIMDFNIVMGMNTQTDFPRAENSFTTPATVTVAASAAAAANACAPGTEYLARTSGGWRLMPLLRGRICFGRFH